MAEAPRAASGDPLVWLRRAKDDLVGARRNATDTEVAPRIACTLAHQAAEKAVKALALNDGVNPPKTPTSSRSHACSPPVSPPTSCTFASPH